MNTTTTPLNGVTYVLNGSTVTVHASRASDRVRILRRAIALNGSSITVWCNGSGMAA